MPKRSNIFQRLVLLLHERLDKRWKVTESEMLTNSLTGEEREVDIVCISKLGEHEIIVSIECTDTKRPVSSPWIEAMSKKHEFLPTSKLVLWSANGFYKPAKTLAGKLGIEIVSQDVEISEEWAIFASVFQKGSIKLIQPVLTHFFDYKNRQGEKCRLDGETNYHVRIKELEIIITVHDVKEFILENKDFRSVILDNATEEKEDFWLKFEPGSEWEVQKEDGEWITPFRIGFGIKANTQQAGMSSKSVKYENAIYTLSSGKSKKGPIELFIKETESIVDNLKQEKAP